MDNVFSINEDEAVKEFNEILEAGFSLQEAITTSLADGKVTWTDTFNFSRFVTKLPAAIDGAEKVKDLFKNFSQTAKEKVFAYVAEKFDIPNDEKEVLIEETVNELFGDIVIANKWAKFKRKAA